MSTTVFEGQREQEKLQEAIFSFAQRRDTGALGTMGPAGLRVSPVKYFLDSHLNIYIQSKGGSKFLNLKANPEVCLLVATPFANDCHQIKGVQFFGKAQVLEANSEQYAVAERLCPWPQLREAKFIQIFCQEAVYVDRLGPDHHKLSWHRPK